MTCVHMFYLFIYLINYQANRLIQLVFRWCLMRDRNYVPHDVFVGSVLLIILASCVVLCSLVCLSSSCVLCPPDVFVGSVLLIILDSCVVLCSLVCLSSPCVLCTQCCQCPWNFHSWLPLRVSPTFFWRSCSQNQLRSPDSPVYDSCHVLNSVTEIPN